MSPPAPVHLRHGQLGCEAGRLHRQAETAGGYGRRVEPGNDPAGAGWESAAHRHRDPGGYLLYLGHWWPSP